MCADMVQSSLWFASFSAASASRIGSVDQILTLLSVGAAGIRGASHEH